MPLKRYGAEQAGASVKSLPFARAVETNGWRCVSDQVAMENGEIFGGNTVARPPGAIGTLLTSLTEADHGHQDMVRASLQSSMMVDCRVAIDRVASRDTAG